MEQVRLIEPNGDILAPLDLLAKCGGYYERKNGSPLVGYAGKYDDKGTMKQYVGEVYANFAKAERHATVLGYFAQKMFDAAHRALALPDRHLLATVTGFCAAPEGGKALACRLADAALAVGYPCTQYIYPEKRVTAVATPESREESELVFDRHEPEPDESWWITEDVVNNASTTAAMVALIESYGAHVAGIICFLNRSLVVGDTFSPRSGRVLPVIALVRKPIDQYRQDDPYVQADIAAGNVVWKPKNEWHRLAPVLAK